MSWYTYRKTECVLDSEQPRIAVFEAWVTLMKKFIFAGALAIAVIGVVVISAITNTHRSPSHWYALSLSALV